MSCYQRVPRVSHMFQPCGWVNKKLAVFSLVERLFPYFALEPFGAVVYLKLSHRSWNVEPDAWSLKSFARGGPSEERTLSFHSMDCPLPKKKEDRSHLEAKWVDDETEKLWEIFGECISGWWFGTRSIFPFSWESHHVNWQTPSFFSGVGTPPTRYCIIYSINWY